jgi:hypothetical protein
MPSTTVQDEAPATRKQPPPPKDRSLRAILNARSTVSGDAGPLSRALLAHNAQPWRPPRVAPLLKQPDREDDCSGPSRKRTRRDAAEARLDSDGDEDEMECTAPPVMSSVEIIPTPTRRPIAKPSSMQPPRTAVQKALLIPDCPILPGRSSLNPIPTAAQPPLRPEPTITAPPLVIPRAPRRVGITRTSISSKPWKPLQPLESPPPSSPPVVTANILHDVKDHNPPPREARHRQVNLMEKVMVRGPNPKAKPLRLAASKPKPKLLCLQVERMRPPDPEPELGPEPGPVEISDCSSPASSAFTDS